MKDRIVSDTVLDWIAIFCESLILSAFNFIFAINLFESDAENAIPVAPGL